MEVWDSAIFVISLIIMMVGMAGIIVPIIPSTPLIWVGAFIYAISTHFEKVTWLMVLLLALMAIFSVVLENLGNVYGAKKFGATRWGIIGSFVGTGAGFFMGGPVGLILGPIVGTIVFELIGGKGYRGALKSGVGNFVGFLGGSLLKLLIGLAMISLFVWKVFFG
jgi:uncharacterized protein YqgC (DUF456 family)